MTSLSFDVVSLAGRTLRAILSGRVKAREVVRQIYVFGVGSVAITVLCVTFIGVIIILEYSFHMKLVLGSDTLVPSFAMMMLSRELAPTVTALLLTSKMGASMAAELSAMKTSEQLDAYRMLGLDPVDLFIAPRVVASAISTLLLSMLTLFFAVIGSWLAAILFLNFSTGVFFQNLFVFTHVADLALCFAKALVFGASIPIVSGALAFRCRFGAEGVGAATTDAVVANSIWIIVADFLITYALSASL